MVKFQDGCDPACKCLTCRKEREVLEKEGAFCCLLHKELPCRINHCQDYEEDKAKAAATEKKAAADYKIYVDGKLHRRA